MDGILKADKSRQLEEQVQIYEDSSRSLGIEYPNFMKFPITRMDLLFWNNIKNLGLKPKQISKNTRLSQFNKIYNDYSLFHFFAGNTEVI